MTLIGALTVLTGVYLLSTYVAKITGGRLPSALLTTPIMMILFWSGFMTAEDVDTSGLTMVYTMTMALLLVNMGTTLDYKMLWKKKKLILVCFGALFGAGVLALTVGRMFFGRQFVIASYPTLAGSQVATYMMQAVCEEKGLLELSAIILLILVAQQWISMPIIANLTRFEGRKMLTSIRNGTLALPQKTQAVSAEAAPERKLIDKIPAKYDTVYLHFFLCAIFSWVAAKIGGITGGFTGGILNASLMGLVIGLVARQLGLIGRDPLAKAKVLPFFMMAMIMAMRKSLANLSPSALLDALVPIIGILLLGAVGIILASLIVGKLVGLSPAMSILVGIQCYSGYPVNYQISTEVIEAITENEDERNYLKDTIVPNLVIGGVISVSISSVIIAGVFVNLL